MKRKVKIKRLLSDKMVNATENLRLHQLLFIAEDKRGKEVEVCRIFSSQEYKQFLVKGYYLLDIEKEIYQETWENDIGNSLKGVV